MSVMFFAMDINAILEDGTEVTNVKGFVIDNKKVYKTSEGTILTGTKKVKTIISSTILVPVELLSYIKNIENE